MEQLLAIAAGGALGAVGRYLAIGQVGRWLGTAFPFGTIAVNLLGSFAMGLLVEAAADAWPISAALKSFLAVGVLGAFTTFSTFSMDVALLYQRGTFGHLAAYVLASVALSIGGLFAGLHFMRWALV